MRAALATTVQALGLAVAVAGCGATFTPETVVSDLRVLSMVANPPEVGPGEPATVSLLYANPQAKVPTSNVWVGCEPDPQDLGRSACNDASILLTPTLITDYPPGLQLLGFATTATYKSSVGVFDPLAADDPIRQSGTVGQIIGIVIGEVVDPLATGDKLKGYFQRIQDKTTQAVVSYGRVLVSQKPPEQRNHNPVLSAFLVDGVAQPPGARLPLEPDRTVALSLSVPDSSRETYTETLASGPVQKREQVVAAWYSTSGRFSVERFDVADAAPTTFWPPGSAKFPEDPLPDRRAGTLWVVLRDDRLGQAFQTWPFFVCDHALATPVVAAVTLDGSGTVLATGTNLQNVLDVLVGGLPLTASGYSTARTAYVGTPPALPTGTYPVTLTTKACGRIDTGLTLTLP